MSEIFNKLSLYFTYPFVRNALIVGVLIALCSSLLGVILVLKRYAYIGEGLSRVAFGAMAVAAMLSLSNDMIIVLPITIVVAILLLRKRQSAKIGGDTAIAMLSVGALAVGYLIINIFSKSANVSADVCSILFGSTAILTLSSFDVILCIGMAVVVLVVFMCFYHKIFAIAFDESFAAATGVNVKLYNLIIAVVTAIVIVLSINLVGSLLITAFVLFPAVSAMQVIKNFKWVMVGAAIISMCSASLGILIAIVASTPVGATIVVVNIVVFLVFYFVGWLKGGR